MSWARWSDGRDWGREFWGLGRSDPKSKDEVYSGDG